MSENKTVIYPFDSVVNIEDKIIRHVNPTFRKNPLSVLRAARLAAQYPDLTIAPETNELMKEMSFPSEPNKFLPECIWTELVKALGTNQPIRFFEVLKDCKALANIFPEVDALFGVPQPEDIHPEIDAGVHTMLVLEQATKISDDPVVRFAALVHDLGKGTTPKKDIPYHHGHEKRGAEIIAAMVDRLRGSNDYRDLGMFVRCCLKMNVITFSFFRQREPEGGFPPKRSRATPSTT